MLPEKVRVTNQEVEKFLEEVIDAALECSIVAFSQFYRCPFEYDVHTFHEILRRCFNQTKHLFNHLQMLFEIG